VKKRTAATALFAYDRVLGVVVAGVDEAGRGCFAGPLLAAAVRLDYARLSQKQRRALAELNDSKQLTRARREALYPHVLAAASAIAISLRCARSIDTWGLHQQNLDANFSALTAVACPGAVLLADGFALPAIGAESPRKIVRGDSTSAAIACASIVAKVCRDRLMTQLALRHPGYGFERHAGYGTAAHQQAIRELGLCSQHRRSFKGVVELGEYALQLI
jgi:ribonuclease HII